MEEYGISEIVESVNGKRRIAAEKVQCDLYDYLTGKTTHCFTDAKGKPMILKKQFPAFDCVLKELSATQTTD